MTPTPDQFRAAAKVLRYMADELQLDRNEEHWWQHVFKDYPIDEMLNIAAMLEHEADWKEK